MSAMGEPEAVQVELPCGYLDEEGKLETSAEIIPMTGKIRKLIARPEVRQNPAKVIDTLLTNCLYSVGSVTRIRRNVTDRLFLGDRDFLVMEIRKISLGNKVNSQFNCDSCGAKMSVSIDLSRDVPIKKMKDVGVTIEEGAAVFTLDDSSLGLKSKFRLPIGLDQHSIAHMYRKNPIAANYALYYSCLVEWNGLPACDTDVDLFDQLPLLVIDFIDENFMEMMPGPDMRVPVDCEECGNEMVLGLESSDFLFRMPKKGRT